MSKLIILATKDKVDVSYNLITTKLTAGVVGSDRVSFDIATQAALRVKLTAQGSSCEIHRDNPDGTSIDQIRAGDPVTRCLEASKENSSDLKRGKFYARPKSRKNQTEIPGAKPGDKTHGKKDKKKKVITYNRGQIALEIKP